MGNILSPIDSSGIIVVEYDIARFPFRKWFESVLGSPRLELLHEAHKVDAENFVENVSRLRQIVEAKMGDIHELQEKFFAEIVEPIFGKIASRQEVPTTRFHFSVSEKNLLAEGDAYAREGPHRFLNLYYFEQYRPGIFHRDRDYGLSDNAINVWIPMTDVTGTGSVWVGTSDKYGEDSVPINVKYGQCIFFNGAERWHGAVWNTTGSTRVSFDIRFVPYRAL